MLSSQFLLFAQLFHIQDVLLVLFEGQALGACILSTVPKVDIGVPMVIGRVVIDLCHEYLTFNRLVALGDFVDRVAS